MKAGDDHKAHVNVKANFQWRYPLLSKSPFEGAHDPHEFIKSKPTGVYRQNCIICGQPFHYRLHQEFRKCSTPCAMPPTATLRRSATSTTETQEFLKVLRETLSRSDRPILKKITT